MKKTKQSLSLPVLAVLIFAFGGCATSGSAGGTAEAPRVTVSPRFDAVVYSRLAIYVENHADRRLDRGTMREIEDEFSRAAIEKGYTISTRSDISAIEKELNIQESDFTEAAMAKRARALNVAAIVLVSVNSIDIEEFTPLTSVIFADQKYKRGYRSNISISARMITAAEAQIMWLSSYSDEIYIGENRDYDAAEREVSTVAAIVAGSLPGGT